MTPRVTSEGGVLHAVELTFEVRPSNHVDDYSFVIVRLGPVPILSDGVIHPGGADHSFIIQRFIEQQKSRLEGFLDAA